MVYSFGPRMIPATIDLAMLKDILCPAERHHHQQLDRMTPVDIDVAR